MKKIFAVILAAAMLSGCICTTTPAKDQKWYEYQSGYMRDGYDGNMPWYFYPVVVPVYVVGTAIFLPFATFR